MSTADYVVAGVLLVLVGGSAALFLRGVVRDWRRAGQSGDGDD